MAINPGTLPARRHTPHAPRHMAGRGININGLPILAIEPDLDEHYRRNVIGGPGAFLVPAKTFEDFGTAIRRKLIMEISMTPLASTRSG